MDLPAFQLSKPKISTSLKQFTRPSFFVLQHVDSDILSREKQLFAFRMLKLLGISEMDSSIVQYSTLISTSFGRHLVAAGMRQKFLQRSRTFKDCKLSNSTGIASSDIDYNPLN